MPVSAFAKDKYKADGLRSSCKACYSVYDKKRYWSDPIKARARTKEYRSLLKETNPKKLRLSTRNTQLKKNYGITHDDYLVMLEAQDHGCACCGRKDSEESKNVLNIDHNHSTGNVRGLLCVRCNTTIGLMDESEDRLLAIINYLRKHNG
jgi:hypothetical protein